MAEHIVIEIRIKEYVKKHAKELHNLDDMKVANDVAGEVHEAVVEIIEKAVRRAVKDKRSTLMGRDI